MARTKIRTPRRKTRWLSLVGHAMTFAGNDTWDFQLMEVSDSAGVVLWNDLRGCTVLRTIVEIVVEPTYPASFASNHSYINYFHAGFAVLADSVPDQAIWDPNEPHADFMWRGSIRNAVMGRAVGALQAEWVEQENAHSIHVDSRAKRKLGENDRMAMFGHWFAPITDHAGAIGYTGRVLIALP